MALLLDFTITQPTDCDNITFTETTGNGVGGYGDSGNPVYTDVGTSRLVVQTPDGNTSIVFVDYKPTQNASPNGTFDINASLLNFSSMPNGVYNFKFELYDNISVVSGLLVQGTKYIVQTGSIVYDGETYNTGDAFVATATTTYTPTGVVNILALINEKDCNFLIYCNLRECLRKLMLMRCDDCDCKDAISDGVTEMVIDFNAAVLAFNLGNYKCAADTIARLEKSCSGICNDCDC